MFREFERKRRLPLADWADAVLVLDDVQNAVDGKLKLIGMVADDEDRLDVHQFFFYQPHDGLAARFVQEVGNFVQYDDIGVEVQIVFEHVSDGQLENQVHPGLLSAGKVVDHFSAIGNV